MGKHWKLCIVSSFLEASKPNGDYTVDRAAIANALLYGDIIRWVTIDRESAIRALARVTNYPPDWKENDPYRNLRPAALSFYETIDEIERLGDLGGRIGYVDINVPSSLKFHPSGEPTYLLTTQGNKCPLRDQIFEIADGADAVLGGGLDNHILTSYYQKPQHWQPYQTTQLLLETLTRILLPDVGTLPLQEILEWREKAKNELGPVRGQMQRLTELLRTKTEESHDMEVLQREAENLIVTEVEPTVLEARSRLEELQKAWYKKSFVEMVGWLTLLPYAISNGSLSAGAAAKAVSMATQAINDQKPLSAQPAVARMVLKIEECYRYKKPLQHPPPHITCRFVQQMGNDTLLYDPEFQALIMLDGGTYEDEQNSDD